VPATIDGSHLPVAVGRRPNTDDLGCAEGGIALDDRGFIRVDADYSTAADGVHAVGDVTGGPQFTHPSWDDHRILFDHLVGLQTAVMKPPRFTLSRPPAGIAG